ncbi:UNVERIFIED_CONTAM: hypothetical protein GTU68_011813 [Idotea baltica]|nr:hypothetical protein [Idotea baltica]
MATLRLGDVAPDFTAQTTEGELKFHDWIGDGWAVLFSHPADYTPVCTTELGTVAKYKVRSVFVIGPDKKIKLMITYPPSTGRNFDEILRVIDSLQLTAYRKLATPANWNKGDDLVISPSVSSEEAKTMFPKGFKEIKYYLRMTPDPES